MYTHVAAAVKIFVYTDEASMQDITLLYIQVYDVYIVPASCSG